MLMLVKGVKIADSVIMVPANRHSNSNPRSKQLLTISLINHGNIECIDSSLDQDMLRLDLIKLVAEL